MEYPGMKVREIEGAGFSNRSSNIIQNAVLRFFAKVISYIFHPVFVPVYMMLFMVYVHPYLFAGMMPQDKFRVSAMAILMFTFFPLVTVGLLKALGFIESVYLHTQKDRIIPLIACGVFYFWITYIWWNSNKISGSFFIPQQAVKFALAIFFASWLGLMINIKIKVSLHAISMGVLLTTMLIFALTGQINFGLWLAITLLCTGLVCTARLMVSDHKPYEIYFGLLAGALAMLGADFVVNQFS
ncbi:MAG TPA: hypothetical protein PK275_04100 [Chitinophagaceae bacterium]|jgi:nitrate reductase NapE component|nr:hypothetical protein [Ferruginibacter sp.]HUM97012.1 hypothetical protein [Chitinophagaceae bacterium]